MSRTITTHPIVWRGVDAMLEIETIRIGDGGNIACHVTTSGAPLPTNHWDASSQSIGWCLSDLDWFAESDPVDYALDVLDAFADGNDKYRREVLKHEAVVAAKVEAARQGELF